MGALRPSMHAPKSFRNPLLYDCPCTACPALPTLFPFISHSLLACCTASIPYSAILHAWLEHQC
jgi:hypothetical protein